MQRWLIRSRRRVETKVSSSLLRQNPQTHSNTHRIMQSVLQHLTSAVLSSVLCWKDGQLTHEKSAREKQCKEICQNIYVLIFIYISIIFPETFANAFRDGCSDKIFFALVFLFSKAATFFGMHFCGIRNLNVKKCFEDKDLEEDSKKNSLKEFWGVEVFVCF